MADLDPAPLIRPATPPLRTTALVRDRLVDALLSQAGITHPALAGEIRRQFGGTSVSEGALLREPVIEGAAAFETAHISFAETAGGPLHPAVVGAISDPRAGNYRFPPDARPYAHQLAAWRHLMAPERRSVLVTSGTGSGKTECFLLPLLSDLAAEADAGGRLSGVRAIMLYPLNALIASQEERLAAWTKPFGGRLRFGLYNGLTPENSRASARQERPEQVLDRTTLRADPPPILVTNVTMLEYMTVRQVDRPLLDRSQGQLRWIILDEAHSYVGSAAAEIALLLRRVLLAFGVTADQVRFVATSATIGEGRDVSEELRGFLRDLAGNQLERVHVVEGRRAPVDLPPKGSETALAEAELADRNRLASHPAVQAFVRAAEQAPLEWTAAAALLRRAHKAPDRVLDAIAGAGLDKPILALRVHAFLRAVPGLWSCLDAACPGAPAGWPFGAILPEQVDACPSCGGAVFELISCRECGEPYLDTHEHEGRLRPRSSAQPSDEFADAIEAELPDSDDAEDAAAEEHPDPERRVLAVRALPGRAIRHYHAETLARLDRDEPGALAFATHDPSACAACAARDSQGGAVLRPFRFGAPFLIGNAAPLLLDGTPPRPHDPTVRHHPPADGRQLLSFTDSRQGTARFAANLQTAAERAFVRGFLYHSVQGSMAPTRAPAAVEPLRQEIALIEQVANPALADLVAAKKRELAALLAPSTAGIAWPKLRATLAECSEVAHWMRQVWRLRDERYENSETSFAEFLLLRELARRPRRANSVETLGLARLRFDALDACDDRHVPPVLAAKGVSGADWRGFLYVLVDQLVRQGLSFRVAREDLHWLLRNGRATTLVPPGEPALDAGERRWPQLRLGSRPGLAKLLERRFGLDTTEPRDQHELDRIFETAWHQLRPVLHTPGTPGYALDFEQARVAPIVEAWLCPVTRRVLPETAFGLSPYGQREGLRTAAETAQPVALPRLPHSFPRGGAVEAVRAWLAQDEDVAVARRAGVWGSLHDAAALLAPYARAAEHSAQQPASRLRRFEQDFKAGAINILNCSTTMEMGVDIGSVATVMMTNVPPALPNYRQRVGRAGRRGQGYAMSLTYTRDTPLDREAFRDPVRYLLRPILAPRVKLDSRRIVQRHVNALLLARWFAGLGGEAMKTEAGTFFGCPPLAGAPPVEDAAVHQCLRWLTAPSTIAEMRRPVAQLTAGTALAGDTGTHEEARAALTAAFDAFHAEWRALQQQRADADKAAASGIDYQLKRLTGENLLKELAVRAVLPGHGFPTHVVAFVNRDKPAPDEAEDGDGGRARRRAFPSRSLDIAIRDYAPGNEVVVDGLVYRSAGVTLNWTRPADDADARQIQSIKTFWSCAACGAADCGHGAPEHCPVCAADIAAVRRFLEPQGFTADMREKPHADTDRVHHIEPEREQVVARGAAWRTLADPRAGRARATAEGLVFYVSGGADKQGYAICLECGRAEPAGSGNGRPLAGHPPLRGTKRATDGLCPGNDRPFKIVTPLALGHEVLTDVAELQPAGLDDPGAAWAFASALRASLARSLGVEPGEMGLTIRRATDALGGVTHSVFLYDRNAGGAGFASQAVPLYPDLLAGMERLLDCQQPGCVRGCSACVLSGDLFKQQEMVDRQPALALVRAQRVMLGAVVAEDRLLPNARFSASVTDDLDAALDRGAPTITIWAGDNFDAARFMESGLARLARRCADRGRDFRLVVDTAWLDMLDQAARLALRDTVQITHCSLHCGSAPALPPGARLLATATPDRAWASRDGAAAHFGTEWGRGEAHPVVCGALAINDAAIAAVDLATLLPRAGTRYREIGNELDGPLAGFGARFAALLHGELDAAGLWRPGELTGVTYADRYLHTPLSIRLALDTAAALRNALCPGATLPLRLVTNSLRPSTYQPRAPTENWCQRTDREAVAMGLARRQRLDLRLEESGAPHARVLTLLHADGGSARIVLDQGFGTWETPRSTRFDFSANAPAQVSALGTLAASVTARGRAYVVVTQG